MEKKFFKNKKILITGGTGSFGSTFAKALLNTNFSEIRIFSRDEKKQEDLRKKLNNNKIKFYIGDTRNFESIDDACKSIDYIFHAAALKQVPSCEFYPMEAVNTNIIGSKNVINAAIKNKVKKLVLLSTDKAVYPINAMGLSKAMAEKILIAKSKELTNIETTLCITRYGNVMNSRGSVIPNFINQIKNGKNITVTNPNMTRYMMSLEESVQLVIYAMKNGKQGEIFIQKSPATTIIDLANCLKNLFKKKNKIKIIGIRHGEKNHETLISSEEMIRAKNERRYFRILPDIRDINYDKFFNQGNLKFEELKGYNSFNAKRLKTNELSSLIKKVLARNV